MPDSAWMSPERYVAARDTCCPCCGSTALTTGPLCQIEACEVARLLTCDTCAASWLAIYELRGYEAAQRQADSLC